ncbi:low affinity iron permease family protein [Brevundimonas goettingensis]|uniref:Low affinity iron permease family protein n=1 Tax=Brevundimonas goettingensis TaxID=2774190 RepID=A0A975C2P7_9CAUL|nr:low affinity iron permease family protein [Brevundimonas goettingensis]QTC92778.1 low affinity iron permease family protein [Brevundimonas goettingensis]
MRDRLHHLMTTAVNALGHPASLVVLLIAALVWRRIEPDSFDLHAVATLVAIAMTLIIQRGQNRDTAALQAKLDELILATEGARNEMAGLDEETADDIEEIKRTS